MPDDETILPSEWLRRLAERRERDEGSRPPADFSETSAAAELVRRRLQDDVEKVKEGLGEMLAEEAEVEGTAPSPPLSAAPTARQKDIAAPLPAAAIEALRDELRAAAKKRSAKSEKRLRKSLRKDARAAGRQSAREAVDSATRTLELQVQAAEEELREHIHAQLSLAIQQARKRGEADARRDLERVLDRVLSDLRGS